MNINEIDAINDLLVEGRQPALGLLAATIDREFQRREPAQPSLYEYAAAKLGVDVTELVVLAEEVPASVAHSVGCWLFEVQARFSAEHVGAHPGQPAATQNVQGAAADLRAFTAATVVLPPRAFGPAPVVLRVAPGRFQIEIELIARKRDEDGLSEAFDAFIHKRRTSESPYRLGSYRVSTDHRGLALKRWAPPAASRELLKLDGSVWRTVDRTVHRVLDLADDLRARGLGTSTGLLLVGPPGTGKTQLGTVVANELLGAATVLVPGTYVTEHFLAELFELASDLSPTLILMDDLDLIAGERGHTNPHRLREFLNVMDGGLADRSGVVVIASTNDHHKVDKAARRSSRFDTVIRMEPPSLEGRLAILKRYLAWCDASLDLAAVARATEGATGADLKELVRAAVIETADAVSTAALLAEAATGRWRTGHPPAGQYL